WQPPEATRRAKKAGTLEMHSKAESSPDDSALFFLKHTHANFRPEWGQFFVARRCAGAYSG
ncbi:MAG: hypothetical protein LKI06_10115, partial [Acetobacter peroxydans]|nr:hypothetical protein [Acetobacter peroxydans]